MGNPVDKTKQAEVQGIFEKIEGWLAHVEQQLQVIEQIREETLSPEARNIQAKEANDKQRELKMDMQRYLEKNVASSKEVERDCYELLQYMQAIVRAYENKADTRELQQKRAEFEEKIKQLTVEPELPDLYQEAMEMYDASVTKFDQVTAAGQQGLLQSIAEGRKELEALKKEQAEILKKQEALGQADFHGDPEKEQKLLDEQQKNLTDKGQKLQEAVVGNANAFIKQINQANKDVNDMTIDISRHLDDIYRRNEVEKKTYQLQATKNMLKLKESYRETKEYCRHALRVLDEPKNRAELEIVFDGISDTKAATGFFGRKKDDTAFQKMKAAMTDYLQNGGEEKAKKAYEECRYYLSGWLQRNGDLKKGSKTENIRNQGVVRMLELMEKMPDFQNSLEKEKWLTLNRSSEQSAEGWELVDKDEDVTKFKRLDFLALESSLARQAGKPKQAGKSKQAGKPEQAAHYAGNKRNSRSFTDLYQRIDAKREKLRAAQEKAAAKAAKDAAKAAKAAKKAKGGRAK